MKLKIRSGVFTVGELLFPCLSRSFLKGKARAKCDTLWSFSGVFLDFAIKPRSDSTHFLLFSYNTSRLPIERNMDVARHLSG